MTSLAFKLILAAASLAFTLVPLAPPQEQPVVLGAVPPAYPAIALAARAEGEVTVEVRVGPDGDVASAEATSGHPLLRRAAESAAARWKFKPTAGGLTLTLTFDFRLGVTEEVLKTLPTSPYRILVARFKGPDTVSHIKEGDEGKSCEVHGFKLERDKVGIVYGLLAFDGQYEEARKRLFPHASRRAEGGCVVDSESARFAEVLYCRACRAAEEKWREEHGPKPEDPADGETPLTVEPPAPGGLL